MLQPTVMVSALFLNLLLASPAAAQTELQSCYRRLEILRGKILKRGADAADRKEPRRIRYCFLFQGDSAARFLVRRLEEMNAEENRFVRDDEDLDGLLRYGLHDQSLPNYHVCFILADMFPRLSPEAEKAVLRAIAASYTPSTYGDSFLSSALLRIGQEAVPYLLELTTNHSSSSVRCRVQEMLNSIGEAQGEAEGRISPTMTPPTLDCKDSPEQRRLAAQNWSRWWDEVGRNLPFPRVPSFFDIDIDESPIQNQSRECTAPHV